MIRRFLFSGLILLAALALTSASHKFYISITQIDINADSHKMEISARVFTDDLEASIEAVTGQKIRMGTVRESPRADSILFDYVSLSLNFKQDGHDRKLKFIGKEVEADVTWIYLESVEGISPENPLTIRNGLLQERFPDQKNIVNLRFGKETVSQIHTKEKPEYEYRRK